MYNSGTVVAGHEPAGASQLVRWSDIDVLKKFFLSTSILARTGTVSAGLAIVASPEHASHPLSGTASVLGAIVMPGNVPDVGDGEVPKYILPSFTYDIVATIGIPDCNRGAPRVPKSTFTLTAAVLEKVYGNCIRTLLTPLYCGLSRPAHNISVGGVYCQFPRFLTKTGTEPPAILTPTLSTDSSVPTGSGNPNETHSTVPTTVGRRMTSIECADGAGGGHTPQSEEHVEQLSVSGEQVPSPHRGGQAPQSLLHVEQVSTPLHTASPQTGGGGGHAPQSTEQVEHVSVPLQT